MNTYIIGLLILLFLSATIAWFISARKKAEKPVKVMLFVLYFWVITFLQILVFAVLYKFF